MNRTAIPTQTKPYVADPRLMAAITGRPASQCFVHPMHIAATLSLGQRVIVMSPDTWLHRRTGTVVALPRPNGLLRDDQITVQIDGDSPLGPNPVRSMDPRRVAPVSTCETCALGGGCLCEIRDPNAGCGHNGCWGPRQTHDCPGVAAERAQSEAYKFARGWVA